MKRKSRLRNNGSKRKRVDAEKSWSQQVCKQTNRQLKFDENHSRDKFLKLKVNKKNVDNESIAFLILVTMVCPRLKVGQYFSFGYRKSIPFIVTTTCIFALIWDLRIRQPTHCPEIHIFFCTNPHKKLSMDN